jgi:hypothetical protein
MFDLVAVGHFAIDLITSPKITKPKQTLGGSPTYVSLAARKLDAKVSVISKVGKDFSDRYITWLKAKGVDLPQPLLLLKGCYPKCSEERKKSTREQAKSMERCDHSKDQHERQHHQQELILEQGNQCSLVPRMFFHFAQIPI